MKELFEKAFDKNAEKEMTVFSRIGFRRRFRTLFKTILMSMCDVVVENNESRIIRLGKLEKYMEDKRTKSEDFVKGYNLALQDLKESLRDENDELSRLKREISRT